MILIKLYEKNDYFMCNLHIYILSPCYFLSISPLSRVANILPPCFPSRPPPLTGHPHANTKKMQVMAEGNERGRPGKQAR